MSYNIVITRSEEVFRMNKRLFKVGLTIGGIVFCVALIVVIALLFSNNRKNQQGEPPSTSTSADQIQETPTPTLAPTPDPTPNQAAEQGEASSTPSPSQEPVTELQATAYGSLWSSEFTFYNLSNEEYLTVQDVRLWESGTETLSKMSINVFGAPEVTGVKVAMTSDKAINVPVSIVDIDGNAVTGDAMLNALQNGGQIVTAEMQYDLIYQIRLETQNGVFLANIRIC